MSVVDRVYPEQRFGGFTRCDGTVHFCARVQALLSPQDVVLDVGCGRGKRSEDPCDFRRRLQDFRGEGRRVIGIDVDPDASTNPFVDEFRQIDDPASWPVESGAVDFIHSDFVLEHVQDPSSFFREAHRVLRVGGRLALRTPNSRSYVALISRLVPNRHHARVTSFAQGGRRAVDVFPTAYRCNTPRKLRNVLRHAGFDAVVYTTEAEPSYVSFSPWAYRIAAKAHSLFPPMLRTTLLAYAQKNP